MLLVSQATTHLEIAHFASCATMALSITCLLSIRVTPVNQVYFSLSISFFVLTNNLGYVAPNMGMTNCTACGPGYYSEDSTLCQSCMGGYYSNQTYELFFLAFVSNYHPLFPMHNLRNRINTECYPCWPGTAAAYPPVSCEPCSPGYYMPYNGYDACWECNAGYFSNCSGFLHHR